MENKPKWLEHVRAVYQRAYEHAFKAPPGDLSPSEVERSPATREEVHKPIDEEFDRLSSEGSKTTDEPINKDVLALLKKLEENEKQRG